jgi:hypothetical protein
MKVLGFNFSKISVEKFPNKAEDIKLNTNIEILNIKSVKTDMLKTKDELIGVKFSYKIGYDPDYAKIEFAGDILLSLDFKIAKDVLKEWKDKKFPEEFQMFVFNVILRKSNIKALELEDEMNLPLHFPLPSLKKSENKQ